MPDPVPPPSEWAIWKPGERGGEEGGERVGRAARPRHHHPSYFLSPLPHTLQTVARLRLLAHDVHDRVDELRALGVVPLGPVVARARLQGEKEGRGEGVGPARGRRGVAPSAASRPAPPHPASHPPGQTQSCRGGRSGRRGRSGPSPWCRALREKGGEGGGRRGRARRPPPLASRASRPLARPARALGKATGVAAAGGGEPGLNWGRHWRRGGSRGAHPPPPPLPLFTHPGPSARRAARSARPWPR